MTSTQQESGGARWRVHPRLRGGQPPYPHRWNAEQMRALAVVCDTFVPSIGVVPAADLSQESLSKGSFDDVDAFYKRSASDVGLAVEVAGHLSKSQNSTILMVIGIVLRMLTSSLGTLLLFGRVGVSRRYPFIQSFVDFSPEQREKAVQSWITTSLSIFNKLFKLFKGYTLFSFYGKVDENGYNPSWSAVGYFGPDPKASSADAHAQKPLEGKVLDTAENSKEKLMTSLRDGDFTLLDDVSHLQKLANSTQSDQPQSKATIGIKCDVVIVGSGSGGGVIAGALAQAGHKVLVLEKGGYFARDDLSLLEVPTLNAMYEGRGLLGTDDGSVSILAGATVGGGSTINWSAALPTPEHVRQEWAKDHGLSMFATRKYQEALDKVWTRASVNSTCDHPSFQNQVLTIGFKKLGYDIGEVDRNVLGEHSCGWCHLGCKTGEKQATSETWLVDAVQAGALILSNCVAQEVLHKEDYLCKKGRKAVGVVAKCGRGKEDDLTVYVEAAVTVVCGGSLNTPPLLLRGGLRNPNIGGHLHMHPVVMGWGYFPEGTGPTGTIYEGALISAVSKEAANWNSSGYGSLLEVPTLHTAMFAGLMPWTSASNHKGKMRKYARYSLFIVLTRDQGSGQVSLNKSKEWEITYSVSPEDEVSMLNGMEKGLRALVAAGAEEVGDLHIAGNTFSFKAKDSSTVNEDFNKFLDGLREKGLQGAKTPVCSAHQMGSCRMGVNSKDSAVDPSCETWEVEDLFIGDASVFPTASGANPMITVQAIAFCTAQNIILKLQDRKSNDARETILST